MRQKKAIIIAVICFLTFFQIVEAQVLDPNKPTSTRLTLRNDGRPAAYREVRSDSKFYVLGLSAFRKHEYEKAFDYFVKATDLGSPLAKMKLAMMYRLGLATQKDEKKAFQLYYQVHKSRITAGTYMVGLCYENGWGVDKDYSKAAEFYQLAVTRNPKSSNSIRALGSLHFRGAGVEKDYAKAFELYSKAAELKHPLALFNVGLMYLRGLGVEADKDKAYEYFTQAADLGESKAMFYIAEENEKQKNFAGAEEMYRKSLDAGYLESGYRLGKLLMSGDMGEKDYAAALEVFTLVTKKGHLNSAVEAGLLFEKGQGTSQDFKMALAYFNAAAERGNALAFYHLGRLVLAGKGTKADEERGMEYIRKASELGCPEADKFLTR